MPPEYMEEDGDLLLWKAWFDAGHLGCWGWSFDGHSGVLICECGTLIPLGAEQVPA